MDLWGSWASTSILYSTQKLFHEVFHEVLHEILLPFVSVEWNSSRPWSFRHPSDKQEFPHKISIMKGAAEPLFPIAACYKKREGHGSPQGYITKSHRILFLKKKYISAKKTCLFRVNRYLSSGNRYLPRRNISWPRGNRYLSRKKSYLPRGNRYRGTAQ